ncbi:MAG TPA: response regulator [Chthoniobacterales bacterium]
MMRSLKASPLKPIDVLMVEDDPTDLMITREALAHAKVLNNLYVVEDGVEAMEFLRCEGEHANAPRPDIILLDLNLPRKSGQEVLAEVKADEHLKDIPVVILTTSKAEAVLLDAYGLHPDCFIVKPVDFEAFAHIVRTIQSFSFAVVTQPAL